MVSCRFVVAACAAVSLAIAQQPAEWIDALRDPARRGSAVAALAEAGAAALPALRQTVLQLVDGEELADRGTLRAALCALERMGPVAVEARSELVAVACRARDPLAIIRAARLLALLVPATGSAELCKTTVQSLRRSNPDLDHRLATACSAMRYRLALGPAPTDDDCVHGISAGSPATMRAACLAIVADRSLANERVLDTVETAFAALAQEPNGTYELWAFGELAVVLAEHRREFEPLLVARGLLWHDLPEVRLQGLTRLHGEPALPRTTVADVIDLLRDDDAEVREHAAVVLAGMGMAGVGALPALAAMAADPAGGRRQQSIARRAAAQLLAAAKAASTPAAGDLLQRFEHACIQPVPALPAWRPDAAAVALLVDLAPGLLHTTGGVTFLRALLDEAPAGGAALAAVVCAELAVETGELTLGQLAVLARVAAPIAEVDDLGDRLQTAVQTNDSLYVGDAVEAMVFAVAGAGADDDAIVVACQSEMPRLALRGLAEAARRGLLLRADVRATARAGALREAWPLQGLGRGQGQLSCRQPLADELRAACALAAHAGGDPEAPTAPIADHFGLADDEVAAWLASRRSGDALLATFAELEAAVRKRLLANDGIAPSR